MNFARRVATHPQFAGPVRIDTTPLPDDPDQATDITIRRMVDVAYLDSFNPLVVFAMAEACAACPTITVVDVCRAIHQWIRDNVRFVRDDVPSAGAGLPEDTEVIIRPADILRMTEPAGDCDCMQSLCGAMLLAARRHFTLRMEPIFFAVAGDRRRPREFSHVYTAVRWGGGTLPVDVSHGPAIGWEAPNRFHKRRAWSLDGVSLLLRMSCSQK